MFGLGLGLQLGLRLGLGVLAGFCGNAQKAGPEELEELGTTTCFQVSPPVSIGLGEGEGLSGDEGGKSRSVMESGPAKSS